VPKFSPSTCSGNDLFHLRTPPPSCVRSHVRTLFFSLCFRHFSDSKPSRSSFLFLFVMTSFALSDLLRPSRIPPLVKTCLPLSRLPCPPPDFPPFSGTKFSRILVVPMARPSFFTPPPFSPESPLEAYCSLQRIGLSVTPIGSIFEPPPLSSKTEASHFIHEPRCPNPGSTS